MGLFVTQLYTIIAWDLTYKKHDLHKNSLMNPEGLKLVPSVRQAPQSRRYEWLILTVAPDMYTTIDD